MARDGRCVVKLRPLTEYVVSGSRRTISRGKAAHVLEDDRVVVERVRRAEELAAVLESTVRHRLEHHVDVAGVIEVAVAEDDRVERRQVDAALRVLHDRARARGSRLSLVRPSSNEQAARRRDLLGDHEAGTGGAHEGEPHVSATSRAANLGLLAEVAVVELGDALERVDLVDRLVVPNAHDPRKSQRVPLRCRPECLDRVERDLEHHLGPHHAAVSPGLGRHLEELRRVLAISASGQPGVRLADVDQLPVLVSLTAKV
jgi:hypothetical protein